MKAIKNQRQTKTDTDSAHDISDSKELPAELSDSMKTTFDAFWNIYSDEMLDIIITKTNIYANQHKGLNSPATSEEMKLLISILLLSGYSRVPYRELYCSTSSDTDNKSVSKAISRNSFREIFSNIHIRDKIDIDIDHYYKVKPYFEILNPNFKRFMPVNNFNVNESMIPYYGMHGTKQSIRGKPIRFGFKHLCLRSSCRTILWKGYQFARNRIMAKFWCWPWYN